MKYLRDNGVFSVGGNDSVHYQNNYAKIFGHEEPIPAEKKPKKAPRPRSPVIKMHKLHD